MLLFVCVQVVFLLPWRVRDKTLTYRSALSH